MPETLSKEEQQALDQMKKTCDKHGPKPLRVVQSCALLKKQLVLEEQQKQAELQSIARNKLTNRRIEALAYVTSRVHAIQNEGTLLLGALMKASGEYDQILAARASKPVIVDILAGVALAALPHLGLVQAAVGRTLRTYGDPSLKQLAKAAQRSTATGWEGLITDLEQEVQKRASFVASQGQTLQKFSQSLDAASKDLIEAVKNPLAARADVDAATAERLQAFQAKNQILTQVIGKIQKALIATSRVEAVLHRFIVWYEADPVPLLESKFKAAGLDANIAYQASEFDKFADLILYDMLRAYMKMHVTFTIKYSTYGGKGPPKELPDDLDGADVSGLDKAQRQMIMNKFYFMQFLWNGADTSRPPLYGYNDFIEKWGATVKWIPMMQRVA
ncbi:MAG: hypothetical protein U0796_04555 [Gemmatales bacterium]